MCFPGHLLTTRQRIHGPRFLRFCYGIALLTLIASCATAPSGSRTPERATDTTDTKPLPVEGEALDYPLINHIAELARTDSLLVARHQRNLALTEGAAASTLVAVDSRLAWFAGDTLLTQELLRALEAENSAAAEFVLHEREYQAALAADWLGAAQAVFALAQIAETKAEQSALGERLFGHLIHLTDASLRDQLRVNSDPDWRSWLEMQVAYRSGNRALEQWRERANNIPRYPTPPRHLLVWLETPAPEKIVLLLPLQGPLGTAGEAVMAGAIEGLYSQYPDPASRPQLMALDAARYANADMAYEDALAAGAELVIGPLTKSQVAEVAARRRFPVPTIVLNQTDNAPTKMPETWTSLSLAPEDEAKQIADLAFGRACRNAIVIASGSERGIRLSDAFESRWQLHGGTVRGKLVVEAPEATNDAMGKLLGSGSSDARIRSVEQAFDVPVDARGRGRSDFECIFMLAPDPDTARTWRPLLVFHMSGNAMVFATSAINDGITDTRNRDLNEVIFAEIPAMLPPYSPDRLSRLRALGSDAVTLAQHWRQSAMTEQGFIRGKTGVLRRKENGAIERALEMATFDGGVLRRYQIP